MRAAFAPAGPRPLRKVLLFQLGSIGDTVVSIPSVRAVRSHFGEETEFWVLYDRQSSLSYSAADVLRAVGGIKEFLAYPASGNWLSKRLAALRLLRGLRSEQFDAVVYLAPSQRSRSSVLRDKLFFRMAGISRSLGFRPLTRSQLYPVDGDGHPAAARHEAWFRLERLRHDGVEASSDQLLTPPFLASLPEDRDRIRAWLGQQRRHPDRPLAAIAPGAKQPANLWPLDRFIELGNRIASAGKYELVVVGGQAEQAAGDACVAAWAEGLNAAGGLNVGETLALLEECALLIGLDTGTTHLASAAGVPCVALYSDKDNPGRWHPLGSAHLVLRKRVPCGGCRLTHEPCPVPGHPCMEAISVEDVWQALLRLEARTGTISRPRCLAGSNDLMR